jgi:GNAT superfamily N-acetyltransferase
MSTGNSKYSIRLLADKDVPSVVELLDLALGTGQVPRTEAFWEWKHRHNPFGPSIGLVAEAGGRIVGVRTFMRWRWQTGGDCRKAVRAVDTVTHPGWRGKGLFTELTQKLVGRLKGEDVGFVFNTPNKKSRPGYLKMGWRDVCRIPLLIRVGRPLRMTRVLAQDRSSNPDCVSNSDQLPQVADLLEEPVLDSLLDEICRDEGRLHTPRSRGYLCWRYGKVPAVRYHGLSRFKESSGALIIVRSRRRSGLRELSLSEVLVTRDVAGVRTGAQLIDEIISASGPDYVLACAAKGTPEREALRRAGFLPFQIPGPRFTLRTVTDEPLNPDPLLWESWRLMIGDMELF